MLRNGSSAAWAVGVLLALLPRGVEHGRGHSAVLTRLLQERRHGPGLHPDEADSGLGVLVAPRGHLIPDVHRIAAVGGPRSFQPGDDSGGCEAWAGVPVLEPDHNLPHQASEEASEAQKTENPSCPQRPRRGCQLDHDAAGDHQQETAESVVGQSQNIPVEIPVEEEVDLEHVDDQPVDAADGGDEGNEGEEAVTCPDLPHDGGTDGEDEAEGAADQLDDDESPR